MYWYRTPPYIRVGRAPFYDEAMRLLEERHPDVSFDWGRILREPPQPLPEREAVRRREHRDARDARRKKKRRTEAEVEIPPTATTEDAEAAPVAESERGPEPLEPVEPRELVQTAAAALLGPDGAARLRNRYVVLKQRIDRVADEAKRAELRAQAETLNPDAWETVEAVRRELDTYEARYEALRAQVGDGKRRRRRGRRKRPARNAPEGGL